jgi:hypothetical protein
VAIALAYAAPATAATPTACSGAGRAPSQTITGEFGTELEGGYVLVPFDVPAGTTAVRIRYCWDQPDSPTSSQVKHTLDLGVYQPRGGGDGAVWGEREFRGWGGSSHRDVTLSAEGFSTEAQYRASPTGHVPGKTTRGFRPGPVVPGRWAAELGVAAVAGQQEGDSDGRVAWRVEIDLSRDPAFADQPYEPAPYDGAPRRSGPGWYAGDMHVHAEHSSLGDATMTDVFKFAFGAPPGGAGLDFITLSDYVTDTAWGEIGRYQAAHPGKLVIRSSEVITYRGHTNNHASLRYVDYRTGPIWERRPDNSLTLWSAAPRAGPQHIFDRVHAAGGWTQVNHPTIFPSEVPLFSLLCRGCPWDYADSETDWRKVDAYEVQTGPAGAPSPPGNEPGPNPFTPEAIQEWDRLRTEGYRITGVASSDSHNAGATPGGVTQSPIGEGTTVVFAPELSEDGIRRGVRAGHAFVRMFGHESPDLRLTARAGERTAMMGDRLEGESATFEAQVLGGVTTAQPRTLVVLRDGVPLLSVPVAPVNQAFAFSFPSAGPGDYRIQVMRGSAIDALSNPITLGARAEPEPPPGAPPGQGPGPGPPSGSNTGASGTSPDRPAGPSGMRLSVRPTRVRAGRRVRFRFKVLTTGGAPARVAGALVRFGGRRARTDVDGVARIGVRHRHSGRKRASASKPGLGKAVVKLRVLPPRKRR